MLDFCAAQEADAMNAVSLKDDKIDLEELAEQVIADAEATIVVTKSGDQVVVLPLDEYNSWKETAYLLSNPANADHLRRSIAEAKAGEARERELLDA
jgi:antitoxin YefM